MVTNDFSAFFYIYRSFRFKSYGYFTNISQDISYVFYPFQAAIFNVVSTLKINIFPLVDIALNFTIIF